MKKYFIIIVFVVLCPLMSMGQSPKLTYLLPGTGYRGERVSIIGEHLPVSGIKVLFGNKEVEIVAVGNNRYEVVTPFVDHAGEWQVVVVAGGKKSNALKYTVKDREHLSVQDGPDHLTVTEEGTNQTYTVKADGKWEIVCKSGDKWTKATPTTGQDNGSFQITVERNPNVSPRNAVFTVMFDGRAVETISVNQLAAKLDKAYMYAYGPYNEVGAKIFGTMVSNLEKDDPSRNSHGGPVALQYPNGDLVAFNANASGHNVDGWSEYAISKDGGRTWNMYNKFPYTYNIYQIDRNHPAWVQQGIVTAKGTIVLFVTHFTRINQNQGSEAYIASGYMRSLDNGLTWSEYQPVDGDFVGNPCATVSKGSTLYVLYDSFTGENNVQGQHVLYVSNDDGVSWSKSSALSLDVDAWYGTMCFMTDGRLIAGAYKTETEDLFYYCISHDNGLTWGPQKTTRLDKNIRNPKMACIGGKYYLCGRAGHFGGAYVHQFVMYQSNDGENWNAGVLVNSDPEKTDGYSDVRIINKGDGPELMVVYSIAYERPVTNEYVFFVKPN